MLREYETLYLAFPDLPQSRQEELSKRVSEIIKNHEGQIVRQASTGKKKLAYRVQKQFYGDYQYLNYVATAPVVAELERVLKNDDRVLKFVTVKLSDNPDLAALPEKAKQMVVLNTFEEEEEHLAVHAAMASANSTSAVESSETEKVEEVSAE